MSLLSGSLLSCPYSLYAPHGVPTFSCFLTLPLLPRSSSLVCSLVLSHVTSLSFTLTLSLLSGSPLRSLSCLLTLLLFRPPSRCLYFLVPLTLSPLSFPLTLSLVSRSPSCLLSVCSAVLPHAVSDLLFPFTLSVLSFPLTLSLLSLPPSPFLCSPILPCIHPVWSHRPATSVCNLSPFTYVTSGPSQQSRRWLCFHFSVPRPFIPLTSHSGQSLLPFIPLLTFRPTYPGPS